MGKTDVDVIVVGYGFAGGIAAIEAADRGASVLVCEKMPNAGGLSICSGGTIRCASNAEGAFQYLKATNAGRTPDDVLKALADGMAVAPQRLPQPAVPAAPLVVTGAPQRLPRPQPRTARITPRPHPAPQRVEMAASVRIR